MDYQYSKPVVIGGLTGAYSATSPFPARSEVAVLAVAFTDIGYICVSGDAAPPTFSNTAGLNADALRGAVFTGAANTTMVPDALFFPLDGPQTVYASVSVASSHTGYVTVVFRSPMVEHVFQMPMEVAPEDEDLYHVARQQLIADAERAQLGGR